MKLIQKTNRNFLWGMLLIFPISFGLLYFSLNHYITDEIDEKLRVDEFRIINQLKSNPDFVSMAPVIEVSVIDEKIEVSNEIETVAIYDPIAKEKEPFRELVAVENINGVWYLIAVRHSTIEDKDFMLAIGLNLLIVLVLVFGLLFIINNRLFLSIWEPFHLNLNKLKKYSFTDNEPLELKNSQIDEFQQLKTSVLSLTEQLQKDYTLLKEFTENASHEIQTPLAIISMTLDELIQEEHSESNYKKLYACFQSVQRLSKLNEKLLLLTKLDNNQFNNLQTINVNLLTTEKVEELRALFEVKKLKVTIQNEGDLMLKMDDGLASLLIVNLLSNVTKYAKDNTDVVIVLTSTSLSVTNVSDAMIDDQLIFERFKKGNDANNSTGLGLAIVKRIAEVSELTIVAKSTSNKFKIALSKN